MGLHGITLDYVSSICTISQAESEFMVDFFSRLTEWEPIYAVYTSLVLSTVSWQCFLYAKFRVQCCSINY